MEDLLVRGRRRSGWLWGMTWGIALLLPLALTDGLAIGQGGGGSRPGGNPAGWLVTLQPDWPLSATGLHRVKVRISQNPPRAATRSTRFWLVADSHVFMSSSIVASQSFTMEAGATFVDGEVYVPVSPGYDSAIDVHVETDGNLRRDRRDLFARSLSIPYLNEYADRTLLFVASDLKQSSEISVLVARNGRYFPRGETAVDVDPKSFPSLDQIADQFQVETGYGDVTPIDASAGPVGVLNGSPVVHAIKPDDLPRSWLGLTAIDTLLISTADFLSVAVNQPESAAALHQWVAAGGQLVIRDAGSEFPQAEAVRQRFFEGRNPAGGRLPEWSDVALRGRRLGADPSESAARSMAFVSGQVVLVADSMVDWQGNEWIALWRALSTRSRPIGRRLSSPFADNDAALNIPGVGQPPVLGFQVLLCVFILLIGPVAYFVLVRKRRLQLMYVVVPLVSLLACGLLLLYAVLSEGLHIRSRVQSFTDLDTATGTAVVQSRETLYSGISPGSYRFSPGTLALPVQPGRDSFLRWEAGALDLAGGSIRPRTPHQITTTRVQELTQGLEVVPAEGGGPPTVTNRFPSRLEIGIVAVGQRYFEVESLAPDETRPAKPVSLQVVRERLRSVSERLSPEVLDPYRQRNNYSPYYYTYMASTADEWAGLECDRAINKMRGSDQPEDLLRPGQFLGILDRADWVGSPRPKSEVVYEMHVVRGQW